CWAAGAIDDYW
nr:immunoglobulin heavy chain junction region [Macaca mulatta]